MKQEAADEFLDWEFSAEVRQFLMAFLAGLCEFATSAFSPTPPKSCKPSAANSWTLILVPLPSPKNPPTSSCSNSQASISLDALDVRWERWPSWPDCPRADPIQQGGTLHDDHSTIERLSSFHCSIPEPIHLCVFSPKSVTWRRLWCPFYQRLEGRFPLKVSQITPSPMLVHLCCAQLFSLQSP